MLFQGFMFDEWEVRSYAMLIPSLQCFTFVMNHIQSLIMDQCNLLCASQEYWFLHYLLWQIESNPSLSLRYQWTNQDDHSVENDWLGLHTEIHLFSAHIKPLILMHITNIQHCVLEKTHRCSMTVATLQYGTSAHQ